MKLKFRLLTGATAISVAAIPFATVACGSSDDIELRSDLISEYKTQFDLGEIEGVVNLDEKPSGPNSGDFKILWNAQARGPETTQNWKTEERVKNASFWALEDYSKAYAEEYLDGKSKTNAKTIDIINTVSDADYNQAINAGKTDDDAFAFDFIILDEEQLLEFSKFEYNGEAVLKELVGDAKHNLKPLATQPLVNIVDYKMLNDMFDLQAIMDGVDTTAHIAPGPMLMLGEKIDPTVENRYTIKDDKKFEDFMFTADEYLNDPEAIYNSVMLFDQVEGLGYGTGVDFPGATMSGMITDDITINDGDLSFDSNIAIDNISDAIGHGLNIKLDGNNNYTTSEFGDSNTVNVVSKGFSYNYIKNNKNLTVLPFHTNDPWMGSRYIMTLDSGDPVREQEKEEFLNFLMTDPDNNTLPKDKFKAEDTASGVSVSPPNDVSFDEYYALWSKGRATHSSVREHLKLIGSLKSEYEITPEGNMGYRMTDEDVALITALNSVGPQDYTADIDDISESFKLMNAITNSAKRVMAERE